MIDNDILLSIVIPAYNSELYIGKCLESICSSEEKNIEIIVVDDGSSDTTRDIVVRQQNNDRRIKGVFKENGGVSSARNAGLSKVSGRYIMFLDADDYLDETVFDHLIEYLKGNPSDFTAYSRNILYTDGSTRKSQFDISEQESSDMNYINELMYATSVFNECWGKIYKKEIIDLYDIKFPHDIAVGEDLIFVYEYFSRSRSYLIKNEELIYYRQHEGSAMKATHVDKRLEYTRILYDIGQSYINELDNADIKQKSKIYYFRVMTNLCREFSSGQEGYSNLKKIYKDEVTKKIMKKLNLKMIPGYKKPEYLMIKMEAVRLSCLYYKLKAKAVR